MPPVGLFFGGGAELLGNAGSSSSSSLVDPCTHIDPHEFKDCFKLHRVWFIVGFSATALVLCCCVVLLARRCCGCCAKGATRGPTMKDILSPLERESFRQGLMRQSQWSAMTSEVQPLLRAAAADEGDQSLSPSTKLLAASPLIRTEVRNSGGAGAGTGTNLRSWLSSLSGGRKAADDLITDANYSEVRRADG